MTFKAVIFDMDGTLLDTVDDIAASMNQVLSQEGWPTHRIQAYKYFVGEGARVLVQRALPEEKRQPETIARVLEQYQTEYARGWAVRTRPYPGIIQLLSALSPRDLPLSILSNKPDEFTRSMASYFLPPIFRIVLGAREGVPNKPDPSGALGIARDLAVTPADVLYLGDTRIDMATAVGAGMYPVGVSWGFRPRQELEEAGARRIIDAPAQVLEML